MKLSLNHKIYHYIKFVKIAIRNIIIKDYRNEVLIT